jgi:hypothetical protein
VLAAISAEIGDDVTHETMVGAPWKQLGERSTDLDLLVVGSRSYGPARRLLLGSTSTKLARHAACPLLVTRAALTARPRRAARRRAAHGAVGARRVGRPGGP